MHAPAHTAPAHDVHDAHDDHGDHPTTGLYLKIGLVLFVLTALEVGAYELAKPEADAISALGAAVKPILVPILLVLSAGKFALVAMYYMHLKMDRRVLTGLFIFSLLIAAVVIVALMILMSYHFEFARDLFATGS